jgi:hypothetical protein
MTIPYDIRFFEDRMNIDQLRLHAPDVFKILVQKGFGRVDDKKNVQFCGLVLLDDGSSAFFLPRSTLTGSYQHSLNAAKWTMMSLRRFSHEVSKREMSGLTDELQIHRISILSDLAYDFVKHGLYAPKSITNTVNNGKIDWHKSISSRLPYRDRLGRPVYVDFKTTLRRKDINNFFSAVHAEVMREIQNQHGWWLPNLKSRLQELHGVSRPSGTPKSWISKLNGLKARLFQEREIRLASQLVKYLELREESGSGNEIFGLNDFHTVWEAMLNAVLLRSNHDRRINWNEKLPRPSYKGLANGEYKARTQGMRVDIVLDEPNELSIIDAKYYEASSPSNAPDWPDISKQYFYEFAMNEVLLRDGSLRRSPAQKIKSYFVFPGEERYFSEAALINRDGSTAASFPLITCIYVNMRDVLKSYASRRSDIQILKHLFQ